MTAPKATTKRIAPGHSLVMAPNGNRFEVQKTRAGGDEEGPLEWRVYRVFEAATGDTFDRDREDCWAVTEHTKWAAVEWVAYLNSTPENRDLYFAHYFGDE